MIKFCNPRIYRHSANDATLTLCDSTPEDEALSELLMKRIQDYDDAAVIDGLGYPSGPSRLSRSIHSQIRSRSSVFARRATTNGFPSGLQKPLKPLAHLAMREIFAAAQGILAAFHGFDKAGVLFEQAQGGVLHQMRGIGAGLGGELRKLCFLLGGELYFHVFQTIEKPQREARFSVRIKDIAGRRSPAVDADKSNAPRHLVRRNSPSLDLESEKVVCPFSIGYRSYASARISASASIKRWHLR
jgi:hypothetical protein